MTDPLTDAIDTALETAVSRPKSVSDEGVSVTNQSIPELIQAAKFNASQNAVNDSQGGMMCRRRKFPGAGGTQ